MIPAKTTGPNVAALIVATDVVAVLRKVIDLIGLSAAHMPTPTLNPPTVLSFFSNVHVDRLKSDSCD